MWITRQRAVALAVAVTAVAALWWARRSLGLGLHPDSVRGLIADLGVWAPVTFVALVTFRIPLGLPSPVLLIAGGLCFGVVGGTVFGALGILLSGVGFFVIARRMGRTVIVHRVPPRLRPAMQLASSRLGAAFIAVSTGYPVGPITAFHTMAGVTDMAFRTFCTALAIGALARAATYAFLGSQLLTGQVEHIAQGVALIALVALLPLLFSRPRWWIRHLLAREMVP